MPDHDQDFRPDSPPQDRPAGPAAPPGFPEPPDPKRLQEIRGQLDRDIARRRAERTQEARRFGGPVRLGQAKDIGIYTMIPALLLAGPAVGYGLGWLIERWWGGTPWPVVGGTLFGLAAAFRQIFLIFAGRAAPSAKKRAPDPGDESEKHP